MLLKEIMENSGFEQYRDKLINAISMEPTQEIENFIQSAFKDGLELKLAYDRIMYYNSDEQNSDDDFSPDAMDTMDDSGPDEYGNAPDEYRF